MASLVEQVPRIGRLNKVVHAEEQIAALIHTYLTLLIFPEMSRLLHPNLHLLEVIVTNADNATDVT